MGGGEGGGAGFGVQGVGVRLASWSSRPQVAGYALLPEFFGG